MSLTILRTWKPSIDEWDSLWRNCPYSTYFHSREWAEIWEVYSQGKICPAPIAIEFSDETQIILPFSKEKLYKGLMERYISSPAGTFGGWLSIGSLAEPHQAKLMLFIAKRYPDLIWCFNPYEMIFQTRRFGYVTEGETHALDLRVGFEEIYRGWSKGHVSVARKARKARKAGVTIALAETLEDWKNYFQVYEDSLNRWGDKTTSTYSWLLFESIFNRSSSNIKLWLAKYDGLIIAGALCFYSSRHVVYWHGAALSRYFELRPVNLLMYESIQNATEFGFDWFDFNPSGNLEGVKAFKRSFGAECLRTNFISTTSLKLQVLTKSVQILNKFR